MMSKPEIEEALIIDVPNVIDSDVDDERYSQRPYEKEKESLSNKFDFQALQQTMFEHLDKLDYQIHNMQSKLDETLESNCQSIRQTQKNIQDFLNDIPK